VKASKGFSLEAVQATTEGILGSKSSRLIRKGKVHRGLLW